MHTTTVFLLIRHFFYTTIGCIWRRRVPGIPGITMWTRFAAAERMPFTVLCAEVVTEVSRAKPEGQGVDWEGESSIV